MQQVTAIEAVVEVARRALAQGIPIAVASGGSTAHVRAGLEVAGILHLFEVVVCAEVRRSYLDVSLNPVSSTLSPHPRLSTILIGSRCP